MKEHCAYCGWSGLKKELLSIENPFRSHDPMFPGENMIYACPQCKRVDGFYWECMKEGCTKEEYGCTGFFPSAELIVYCPDHMPGAKRD